MSTIDHKAQAELLLSMTKERYEFDASKDPFLPTNGFLKDSAEVRQERREEAQVHATLYLAEQQRIANRIAIAVAIRGDLELGGTHSEVSSWLHDGNGVQGYFSATEKEALGLS